MSSGVAKTFPARDESLGEAIPFVAAFAGEQGFPRERIQDIELVLEEILVNIMHYGYPDGGGDIGIRCLGEKQGAILIEITDHGVPFDITTADPPDLTSGIEERKVGGLGIFFVRRLVNDLSYAREGDVNIVRLEVGQERPVVQ